MRLTGRRSQECGCAVTRSESRYDATTACEERSVDLIAMDRDKIEMGGRLILAGLGVDPDDSNFRQTPHRVAKV
jgi:GTP cyclohydrolase I